MCVGHKEKVYIGCPLRCPAYSCFSGRPLCLCPAEARFVFVQRSPASSLPSGSPLRFCSAVARFVSSQRKPASFLFSGRPLRLLPAESRFDASVCSQYSAQEQNRYWSKCLRDSWRMSCHGCHGTRFALRFQTPKRSMRGAWQVCASVAGAPSSQMSAIGGRARVYVTGGGLGGVGRSLRLCLRSRRHF